MKGRTDLVMFDATLYVRILREALIPSARRLYPGGNYLFMQDNDPKHTSRCAREFFADNGIEWWKTPPESPNFNPIETLWHEYIRREVKPKTKADLLEGIRKFWGTVSKQKCQKYIRKLSQK
jgi:transposase